jgi:SAM-dependent methyltransferase
MRSRSFLRALLAGAGIGLVLLVAWLLLRPSEPEPAQQLPAEFNPADFVKARPRLDAPYVVTDYEVVDAMLAMARVRPNDVVVDLGSGDGRILIAAARSHGARGFGVDIDPIRIRESNANARAAGVAHRVSFRQQDLFRTPIRGADVLTLYLSREINAQLRPRILAEMRPGTRVVSHDFDMGDWRYDQRQQIGTASIYMWIVPARVGGTWRLAADGGGGTLQLEQSYQQVGGTLTGGDGAAARVEQGRIAGDTIRFVTHLGGRRREFEGRIEGNRIVSTNPRERWTATRTG